MRRLCNLRPGTAAPPPACCVGWGAPRRASGPAAEPASPPQLLPTARLLGLGSVLPGRVRGQQLCKVVISSCVGWEPAPSCSGLLPGVQHHPAWGLWEKSLAGAFRLDLCLLCRALQSSGCTELSRPLRAAGAETAAYSSLLFAVCCWDGEAPASCSQLGWGCPDREDFPHPAAPLCLTGAQLAGLRPPSKLQRGIA